MQTSHTYTNNPSNIPYNRWASSFCVVHTHNTHTHNAHVTEAPSVPCTHTGDVSMDNKEARLDTLCQQTQEQWNVLQDHVTHHDSTTTTTTTAVSVNDALRQELHHITAASKSTAKTPWNCQDRPSIPSVVTDIVSTFDELRCINAILDQQIHHAQEKHKTLQSWNDQHRQVQANMITMMRSTISPHPDNGTHEEKEWLRSELSHVAQLIQIQHQPSSTNNVAINDQQHEFTLDGFILDLIQKYRKSPMDPYILVTTHTSIPQRYIQLLLDCHVIQRHPQSDQLVCLNHS